MEPYKLVDAKISHGMSFVLNCKFWKTKYDNIFITDYDIFNHKKLDDDLYIMFKKQKGYFYYTMFSRELIEDKKNIDEEIERLNNRNN